MANGRGANRRLWQLTATSLVECEAVILLLEGRLGHTTAIDFERAARRLVGPEASCLVVDLSSVTYLSSAALRIIDGLSRELSATGGRLTLRAPTVPARLALELAGLLNLVIE